MTHQEIKQGISERLDIPKEIIKCRNCKLWGGNNQRVINSVGESTCLSKKIHGKVAGYQFCKHFCPLEEVIHGKK